MEDYRKIAIELGQTLISKAPETREDVERMLPELKESEDERIRKSLSTYFAKFKPNGMWDADFSNGDIVAWIERQGEHADFRNKIQIGDKVTRNKDGVLVNLSQLKRVAKKDEKQGEQKPVEKSESELRAEKACLVPKFRLGQRIKHKKGESGAFIIDRIVSMNYVGKNGEKVPIAFQDEWELVEQKPILQMVQWKGTNLKEVIDFTGKSPKFGEWFKTWDEYESYVHSHGNIFKIFDPNGSHMEVPVGAWIIRTPDGYNVPSLCKHVPRKKWWTLEEGAQVFLEALSNTPYNNKPITDAQIITKELLKFLSDASSYNPDALVEQKPEWREEDEEKLNHIICDIKSLRERVYCKTLCNEEIDWLKSIKDRVLPQPKQEWSEDDDKKRKGLIKGLEDRIGFGWTRYPFSREEYIDWLKSLSPQNRWKPSDEQMVALKHAFNDGSIDFADMKILGILYEQLKALHRYEQDT